MLEVNPTRMELLRLKKRLAIARRGHKLLKDKQDELMRRFMQMVYKVRDKREEVEKKVAEAIDFIHLLRMNSSETALKTALAGVNFNLDVEEHIEVALNVKLPHYEVKTSGDLLSYGTSDTPPVLDSVLLELLSVVEDLVELAELEARVKTLAEEIEKTRRRVNALEYNLIPNLEETIRYISMKISEMERSDLSRLMKIKDIVRKESGV